MNFEAFKAFAANEDGAVTVDWVVLTAALVGLGLAVISVVSNGMESLTTDIETELTNQNANTNPFENNTFGAAP